MAVHVLARILSAMILGIIATEFFLFVASGSALEQHDEISYCGLETHQRRGQR
ncbi:MAG TPA: hypothetical protein PLG17_03650 [Thermodesulfobacteriota bacterium]|nr:hypothetical protein [Deltaproteobacteria bacterium]HNR13623.1 hypothetical protein [Thermodesulfobacteriota bacterium]HNU71085.1 hypothetical protein [Thermodesulfobacteriota bacterium]HOC38228.1 hypothetical protein [Thermodesulfobacteriota bacterium]HQO77586.1 hypothetical protein [Thermodesulfobacteriota bacterium]